MLADRATGQVPQPENLMRSGNTVENAGKPNQTAIGLIEAVSAQSSTQYEIETRTAQRKSIVRDAILKFSENTDLRNKPEPARRNQTPDPECENKGVAPIKNVNETKPEINPCNPPILHDLVIDNLTPVKTTPNPDPQNQIKPVKPNQDEEGKTVNLRKGTKPPEKGGNQTAKGGGETPESDQTETKPHNYKKPNQNE